MGLDTWRWKNGFLGLVGLGSIRKARLAPVKFLGSNLSIYNIMIDLLFILRDDRKEFTYQELSKALETRELMLLPINLFCLLKRPLLNREITTWVFPSCQYNLSHHICSPYCTIKNACHSSTIKEEWNEVSLYSYSNSLFQAMETRHLCEISHLIERPSNSEKKVYTSLEGSKKTERKILPFIL